jgi:hypothetical protein
MLKFYCIIFLCDRIAALLTLCIELNQGLDANKPKFFCETLDFIGIPTHSGKAVAHH